jgi:membrane-bound serine protease (ClpP class)
MNPEFWAILLLVIGCGLIVAEVFIPSGGSILVLCVLSFVGAVWFAYKAWWETSPGYFASFIVAMVLLIPGVIIGVFRLLSNTRVGDRILLAAPDPRDVTPYQAEQAHLAQYIGRTGTTLTLLNPGGLVSVNGERVHCFSEGIMIAPGTEVEVVEVRGTRVLVRLPSAATVAAAPPVKASEAFLVDAADGPQQPSPLDFDVPQG